MFNFLKPKQGPKVEINSATGGFALYDENGNKILFSTSTDELLKYADDNGLHVKNLWLVGSITPLRKN